MKREIDTWCMEEYGTHADFSDMERIPLMYTQYGFIDVNVYIDAVHGEMWAEADGVIGDREPINAEDIKYLDFGECTGYMKYHGEYIDFAMYEHPSVWANGDDVEFNTVLEAAKFIDMVD